MRVTILLYSPLTFWTEGLPVKSDEKSVTVPEEKTHGSARESSESD